MYMMYHVYVVCKYSWISDIRMDLNFSVHSTQEELSDLQQSLELQRLQLERERGRQQRLATSLTDQMQSEAQVWKIHTKK